MTRSKNLYFNSIKVRLNLEMQEVKEKFHIFQFHKGTIKPLNSL